MYSIQSNCRICGGTDLTTVFNVGEDVALSGRFPKPGETVPSGPLTVLMCESCGLSQLRENYPLHEMYGPGYGYQSSLNPTMVAHLDSLANLVMKLRPNAGSILDIGSNDGTFLSRPALRKLYMVGVDPVGRQYEERYPAGALVIPQLFTSDSQFVNFDVVTSFAMFYDIPDPVEFARNVHRALNPGGLWLLEVGSLFDILKNTAFDTFCHEHLEYYRLEDIQRIASMAGFRIVYHSCNQVNGGSFVVALSKEGGLFHPDPLPLTQAYTAAQWSTFPTKVEEAECNTFEFLLEAENPIGLGASTKGNILLQYFGLNSKDLQVISEVNPDKFGRVTPGSNIPIVSDNESHNWSPSHWFVLPWHFREHMIRTYQGIPLFFPLPHGELHG